MSNHPSADLNTLLTEYRLGQDVLEMIPPPSLADTVNLARALNNLCADILPQLENLAEFGTGFARMHATDLRDQLKTVHPQTLERLEEVGLAHFSQSLTPAQKEMICDSITLYGLTINPVQDSASKTRAAQQTIAALKTLAPLYDQTQPEKFYLSVPDDGGPMTLTLEDPQSHTRLIHAVQSAPPAPTPVAPQTRRPKGPMN